MSLIFREWMWFWLDVVHELRLFPATLVKA